jgi:hypothetical protein
VYEYYEEWFRGFLNTLNAPTDPSTPGAWTFELFELSGDEDNPLVEFRWQRKRVTMYAFDAMVVLNTVTSSDPAIAWSRLKSFLRM